LKKLTAEKHRLVQMLKQVWHRSSFEN
jgi:hypothetical protein